MKYGVEISNKGGSEFFVTSKDGAFTIDTEGKEITPLDSMLAALGACMGYYIRRFARTANIQLDMFSVKVESDLAKDKGYYFKNIAVDIDLKGALIDDVKKRALVEFVKNCPVHNTLKNNPDIDVTLL